MSVTIGFSAERIEDLRNRALEGESVAQMRLAEIYAQGIGVEKNLAESIKWCQVAADAGVPEGQYSVGIVYLKGLGAPRNVEQAIIWLKRAGYQKHVPAIMKLGKLFSREPSVMNASEAMKWFRIGANLDDVACMLLLANMYTDQQELEEAFRLTAKAASRGSVVARTQLGQLYERGIGVPVDLGKAAECYLRAASHGDGFAQAFIAKAYLYGDGVVQNDVQAAAWLQIASRAKYLPKQMLLMRDYIKLTPTQNAECESLITEFSRLITVDPAVDKAYLSDPLIN